MDQQFSSIKLGYPGQNLPPKSDCCSEHTCRINHVQWWLGGWTLHEPTFFTISFFYSLPLLSILCTSSTCQKQRRMWSSTSTAILSHMYGHSHNDTLRCVSETVYRNLNGRRIIHSNIRNCVIEEIALDVTRKTCHFQPPCWQTTIKVKF